MKKFLGFVTLLALLTSAIFPYQQASQAAGYYWTFIPQVGRNTGATPPKSPTWTPEQKAAIASTVAIAGTLPTKDDNKDETENQVITDTIDNEDYWVNVENHYVVENKPDIMYLGMNDDVIWPGALIKGDQAHDFVYTPITLPRAPVVLSVNLENVSCAGELQQRVDDPNLGNIREGIRLLLQKARNGCDIIPAQADWNKQEVYNESSLNLALGANVNYSSINLKTRFHWNDESKKTKIIATYRQTFYEVNINTPTTPADVFNPAQTSVSEINAQLAKDSNPMYVAGVKYGMMALMFFESSYSRQNLEAAMDLAYSGAPLTGTITGTLSAQQVLNSSNINIVVYGGSTAGLSEIYTGIDGFYQVIHASASGGPDSPGVPLLYKFRNLKDNNLALITFTTNYSLSLNRFPMHPKIRVLLEKFRLDKAYSEDWPFNTQLEMKKMALFIGANDCTHAGSCVDTVPAVWNIGRGMMNTGVTYLMSVGEEFDPGADAYVDITYNNDQNPYDWGHSKLILRAEAFEFDIWPDPSDQAEKTMTFDTGPLIMEGAVYNMANGDIERTYTMTLIDGENFTFTVTIIITLTNP